MFAGRSVRMRWPLEGADDTICGESFVRGLAWEI
jgi:hypothetical protein